MTNEVYIVTNTVVTSFDVLKQINDTYSTEFTRLLTVMGLLVGFGAVVLPLWFQFREAKTRRAEMHTEFQQFIEHARADFGKEIDKKFAEKAVSTKAEMDQLKSEIAKNWAQVAAVSSHAQMKIAVNANDYHHAAESAVVAIRGWCVCEDHSNVLRTIEYLTASICPKLKQEDLESHTLLPQLFTQLEKDLIEANKTGFLSDKLEGFKKAKKEILKRQ